jgi:hypothetical protein
MMILFSSLWPNILNYLCLYALLAHSGSSTVKYFT